MNYLENINRVRKRKQFFFKKSFKKETKRLSNILIEKYNFKRLYLFGSLVTSKPLQPWSDIDFAIEGIKEELFLKAYALILKNSKFSIDLKPFEDMDEKDKKNIRENGVILYEKK